MNLSAFVFFVCLLLLSQSALAIPPVSQLQPKPPVKSIAQHWCDRASILGGWNMVYFKETPPGQATDVLARLPQQYLFFTDNGTLMLVNTNRPVTNTKSLLGLLRTASGEAGYSYTLGANGDLQLKVKQKTFDHNWCQVVPATNGGYQQGDLILTQGDKRSQLVRVFRKIAMQ